MAKFDPRKHDLTPGEARFLTDLSKLSVKDVKRQIDNAATEIIKTREKIEKAKTDIQKSIDTAVTEARSAAKKHGELNKKLGQIDVMLALIENAPPSVANAVAKKLEKLNKDTVKVQTTMTQCLTKASGEIGAVGTTFTGAMGAMTPAFGVLMAELPVIKLP